MNRNPFARTAHRKPVSSLFTSAIFCRISDKAQRSHILKNLGSIGILRTSEGHLEFKPVISDLIILLVLF